MAKKSLIRRKLKKPRIAEATKRLVNEKFWGEKPPAITDRGAFLTWCSNMVDPSQGRKWLEEYLRKTGRTSRGVPDKWINPSVCHRARLKTLGAPFTKFQDAFLERGIHDALKHVDAESEVIQTKTIRLTIADHIREKFSEVMGEIEGMLDDGVSEDFDVAKWYRENNVSATVAARVSKKLDPRVDEMTELLAETDTTSQLYEGYERVPEDELEVYVTALNLLITDTDSFVRNEKRARAPRAPKPASLEKKLKHINESYLRYSREWNITSLEPAKIVGASEFWTLNVKYKLLTVFRADKMGGNLDVVRCKVTGYNQNDSYTYRLGRGRGGDSIIEAVMKSSPSMIKDLVKNLKLSVLQERIGEHTILLRRK